MARTMNAYQLYEAAFDSACDDATDTVDYIVQYADFLSCLFGSSPPPRSTAWCWRFLSCLFGSSQRARCDRPFPLFLSCLFGSSLDRFCAKSLPGQAFSSACRSVPFFSAVE